MTSPILTATEQQLAALLSDKSIPDSVKSVLASTFQRTIEMERKLAEAEAATKAAEAKAAKAKSLKEMLAAGPIVYVEAPGTSKEGKAYPAKVCVNPYAGAHPFYGQLKLTPNQMREFAKSLTMAELLAAADECDKLHPVAVK